MPLKVKAAVSSQTPRSRLTIKSVYVVSVRGKYFPLKATHFVPPVVPSFRVLLSLKEREKIRDVLKESGHKIRFRSERATVQSVRSRLTSGCQILHITGHGDAEALEFESEKHCGIAETLKVYTVRRERVFCILCRIMVNLTSCVIPRWVDSLCSFRRRLFSYLS